MIRRLLITLCFGFFAAAQAASADPAEPGQCYALLVGGLAGPQPYGQWYSDWLARFKTVLTKNAGVPDANVTVLSGDAATSDAILDAIGAIAKRAKPQDQFILFIVGHGENGGEVPMLTLRGPDLNVKQLAGALEAVQAGNQIILNFSASSGDFLKSLVAPNRINIAATSPTETEEPVFAEFFLRGLESKRADAAKNGTITLLEAFNWAAQHTVEWIARWTQTTPEKPDLENPQPAVWKANGKETIEIFDKLYSKVATRKLDPSSDRKSEDGAVEIQPPDGAITAAWSSRRVIDEHAMLEDCGKEVGVSILVEKGLQPIVGQNPKDPGYLAAHTVLGHPSQPPPTPAPTPTPAATPTATPTPDAGDGVPAKPSQPNP